MERFELREATKAASPIDGFKTIVALAPRKAALKLLRSPTTFRKLGPSWKLIA